MGCACIKNIFQKQKQRLSLYKQDSKVFDASLIQIMSKPVVEIQNGEKKLKQQPKADFKAVPNKDVDESSKQSPVKIIVQEVRKDTLNMKKEQKMPQSYDNNINKYDLLQWSLEDKGQNEIRVILYNYVLTSLGRQIIFQTDRNRIFEGITLGQDFVAEGVISLKGLVCAIIESIDKVEEVCGKEVPTSIGKPSKKKKKSSDEGNFEATLFSQKLQVELNLLISDFHGVSKLCNKQRVGFVSNKKSIQNEQFHKNIQKMSTFEQQINQMQSSWCQICLTPIQLSFLAQLQGCFHVFHFQCMHQHIKSNINSNFTQIRCPIEDCKNYLTANDIQNYLDNDLMDRYYQMSLDKYVQSNIDVVSWCPTAGCSVVFQYQKGINKFNCPLCRKSYCLTCRTEYHSGITCEEYQARKNLSPEDKSFLQFAQGFKFKQCPECRFWVERISGCNHIKCRCGITFCYECGGYSCGSYTCKNSDKNKK